MGIKITDTSKQKDEIYMQAKKEGCDENENIRR